MKSGSVVFLVFTRDTAGMRHADILLARNLMRLRDGCKRRIAKGPLAYDAIL